jgi:putative transposase
VATALLSELVDCGLDTSQGLLCVVDGSKALRKVVRDVLGERTPVHRCVGHKERNMPDHLPERERPAVKRRLRRPWALDDHRRARDLAAELGRSHPGAAAHCARASRTVTRLGVRGALRRTLESTNPCESVVEFVRRTSRNVKRWSSGEMALRWTAAGMLEAERQFRQVVGYEGLAQLAVTVDVRSRRSVVLI